VRKAPVPVSLALFAVIAAGALVAAPPPSLKAILELGNQAYYAGDPVLVRISIWNDGDTDVEDPSGDVPSGFELYDGEGKRVAPAPGTGASGRGVASGAPAANAMAADAGAKGAAPGSAETGGSSGKGAGGSGVPAVAPRLLTPGAFHGYSRDLTRVFPRLKEPGTYRLHWSAGGLTSNTVDFRIVPPYDPARDYTARIETDLGPFTLEFLRKDAPIAVKTFIDLAHAGFYDGMIFHYVEPDRVVASGDPTGTGQGGPGFSIAQERSQVKMLAGTVILRASGRPPANGSIFAILLAPRPDYEGTTTAFAQVVEGLDVVRKISQVPASPRDAPQPHRPLTELRINRIVVKPKAG